MSSEGHIWSPRLRTHAASSIPDWTLRRTQRYLLLATVAWTRFDSGGSWTLSGGASMTSAAWTTDSSGPLRTR